MLSDRKLQSNRLNAQKSTGPRTTEGKARSSLNAVKTGLFSGRTIVLPGEAQEDYNALRDAILEDVDQSDVFELLLADRIIAARWKLARLITAERRMHNEQSEKHDRELYTPVCKLFVKHYDDWDAMSRHEQRIENQLHRALRELRQWRAQKQKTKNEPKAQHEEEAVQSDQAPVSERSEEPDPMAKMPRFVQKCSVMFSGISNPHNEPTDRVLTDRDSDPTALIPSPVHSADDD